MIGNLTTIKDGEEILEISHPTGRSAHISVSRGSAQLNFNHGARTVVSHIDLGLTVDGSNLDFGDGSYKTSTRNVTEAYRAYTGKTTGVRAVDHVEATISFVSSNAVSWRLVIRVAPDGFAWRYVIDSTGDSAKNTAQLCKEFSRIPLDQDQRVWSLEYQTWYETLRFGKDVSELEAGDYGFPTLVGYPLHKDDGRDSILYSESDIDETSSGSHLRFEDGGFAVVAADDPLEVSLPHETPWRVAIVGDFAHIVSSTFVDDLARPADPEQKIVTRPGRAAWSWWSSQYSGAYYDHQIRFVDYATQQGWEHVLVDCGWDSAWVPDLVAYASERGIQIHIWSAWSDLQGEEGLRKLALWKSWGVAGIKVDFMESESRVRYEWYKAILDETAKLGLMVNFHGSVIPRGWQRTYPQVVSYEAIRGSEYYVFYGNPLTPAHNVIQPFTRNVVGSMDYTPVAFSAPGRQTSEAHELALSVVFESGITHFADDPKAYAERPLAEEFLRDLAPSWDEVRLLAGHPDVGAVIARRHGDSWFIGGIFTGDAHDIAVPVGSLIGGKNYEGWYVTDSADDTGLKKGSIDTTKPTCQIHVVENGGFAALLKPVNVQTGSSSSQEILKPMEARVSTQLVGATGVALNAGQATEVLVPPRWHATRIAQGSWHIEAGDGVLPGSLAVATLCSPGMRGTQLYTPIRLVKERTPGHYDLSTISLLSARNSDGPVEHNLANGGGDPNDGHTFSVGSTEFERGIGVTNDSSAQFLLAGQGETFSVQAAVDDETPTGSAHVSIVLDGAVAASIDIVGGEAPALLEVSVAGAQVLELRSEPIETDQSESHVDWLNPQLIVE